jgi:class 3 adenylate cyclase
MARYLLKSLDAPDDVVEHERLKLEAVDLADVSVGWQVLQPGWRWSTHTKPIVGGDLCRTRHVGLVLEGRLGVTLDDGTSFEMTPRDVYIVPPGHDGYVIGDEPAVLVEWSGVGNWVPTLGSLAERVLATLIMTDIVDSTGLAARLGDRAWRFRLADHNERMRDIMGRFGGREVSTTGDGFLGTFDGAARAVRCAAEMVRAAGADEMAIRAAVNTGELELVGEDVRGMVVHETARILGLAGAGEVLVSALTRQLSGAAGVVFVDHGEHELRGIDGLRRLYAVVPVDSGDRGSATIDR